MPHTSRYTSEPPATGAFVTYDRKAERWVGFYDGCKAIETQSTDAAETRAKLDTYICDLLRRREVAR